MRYFLLLLLLFLLGLPSDLNSAKILGFDGLRREATGIAYVDTALRYIGIPEQGGNNRGFWVEQMQKTVKISKGSNWCAAFVRWVLDKSGTYFPVRSGVAKKYIMDDAIDALEVFAGYVKVPPGALTIWGIKGDWRGHIGINYNWSGISGYVIEGNTSGGNSNDGDRVAMKHRKIQPYNHFRIEKFQPVKHYNQQ